MLTLPRPTIKVYPIGSVIAEKFEAIVDLGMSNARMKDFYDLSNIADLCDLDGGVLAKAVSATFATRETSIPEGTPTGLTEKFYQDKSKIRDWKAFLKSHGLPKNLILEHACMRIQELLLPVAEAVRTSGEFPRRWDHGQWVPTNVDSEAPQAPMQ